MGARRQLLVRSQWIEFSVLGFVAGILAAGLSETLTWILYMRIFAIDFQPYPLVWWGVPLLGAVLTGIAGMWSSRGVLDHSPVTLLRQL